MKIFRISIAIALAFFASQLLAQAPWVARNSGTTANLWGAVDASFASNGNGKLVVVGEQGTILTSSDQGVTWTRQQSGTTAWLTAVTFEGFSNRYYVVGDGGTILSSPDAVTWTREISPTSVRLNGVAFRGEGLSPGAIIYAVGESGAGLLRRDAAGIWTRNDVGFGDRWLRGLAVSITGGELNAVGQGGAIFKPSAGGGTWEQLPSGVTSDLEAVATWVQFGPGLSKLFPRQQIVGANGTVLGAASVPTTERLRGVCRLDDGALNLITNAYRIPLGGVTYAVGTNGVIVHSADEGHTWQQDTANTTRNLNGVITCARTNQALAVGDGGTILQTAGVGPTITRQPTFGYDSAGQPYVEGGATGDGPLVYYWLQVGAGAPRRIGSDFPRQQLSTSFSFSGELLFPSASAPIQLLVASPFGRVLSTVVFPSQFLNLATRAMAGTNESTLIGGFSISGDAPTIPHTVLVRAVGPALAAFGVTSPLSDPTLQVYSGAQVIASNAGWESNANVADLRAAAQTYGAFPLPAGSKDSALLLRLPPGNYTAQVTSAGKSSGVALVEVYDVEPPQLSQLMHLRNISARAQVTSGEGVLIGGLVVGGGLKKTVLLRAAGPALAQFSLPGLLANPKLTLLKGNSVMATATAWGSAANAADIRDAAKSVSAFAFAEGSADAAMVVQLDPGAYTLLVTGADGGTGVALVEVYEVP